ncbi:MAG: DNA/RNA non-specific endonuclease [Sphingobacteriales bacterium]|nr:MAG: DNA/RNA non-specific endonuclease [Sphingobacteriales bacterium]
MRASTRILFPLLLLMACHSQNNGQSPTGKTSTDPGLFETLETGSKGSYATATVQLNSGEWRLEEALIGHSAQDAKNGASALRIKPGGTAEMQFDIAVRSALSAVQLANYSGDAGAALTVYSSTDGGRFWKVVSKDVRAAAILKRYSFNLPVQSAVRLRFVNTGTGRLNLDDIDLSGKSGSDRTAILVPATPKTGPVTAGRDNNMALGNPSNAGTGRDNYLLQKPQYALSYNNSTGIANWVSWHLSAAWMGSADRCNCFAPDAALPGGFLRVLTSNYTGSGFDRGHLCPSADRSADAADNEATFLMTNITPQSPQLNQQPWAKLEDYCRRLAERDLELYIIAGSYGEGGVGSNGDAKVIGGKISVPAQFWKIIVVLPQGENDLKRVTKDTRVIAVDMPNVPEVSARNWNFYTTTVSTIEQATGYRFFSNLPADVQTVLKQKQDGQR